MKGEQLLRCMGNVKDCFIEEVNEEKETKERLKKKKALSKRKLVPAACLFVCILLGGTMAIAKTKGIHLLNFFSDKEESGYDLQFDIEKVPEDIFSGDVKEVHSIIKKQYQAYEPFMSQWPGSYEKAFSNVEEAIDYLGIEFIEHPIAEKEKAVTLNITGKENGEFESVCLSVDYHIDGFRVSIWDYIYCNTADSSEIGVRASEYEEYKSMPYKTKSGTEVLLIESSANENGFASLDGYFVKEKVLYTIHVIAEEGETEEGLSLLERLLEKY